MIAATTGRTRRPDNDAVTEEALHWLWHALASFEHQADAVQQGRSARAGLSPFNTPSARNCIATACSTLHLLTWEPKGTHPQAERGRAGSAAPVGRVPK
jgi:hypothetical protein